MAHRRKALCAGVVWLFLMSAAPAEAALTVDGKLWRPVTQTTGSDLRPDRVGVPARRREAARGRGR